MDVTEPALADSALRRRLLGIGLGGAAVSLLPFLVARASATTPNSGPSDSTPAATTTAPPKRPTEADVALLGFAQTIELAARNLYDVALATDDFDEVTRAVIATIRESHEAYATALSGTLGREAPQTVNPIFDELQTTFAGDLKSVLDAAYSIESTAVATHLDILDKLQGVDGAALIASIVIVEARHATVLAYINGSTDLDALLVDKEADALTPAEG
ncbi:MAG: ferritin-like domain-containing protein [Ilumatobacteraceae bacterium]